MKWRSPLASRRSKNRPETGTIPALQSSNKRGQAAFDMAVIGFDAVIRVAACLMAALFQAVLPRLVVLEWRLDSFAVCPSRTYGGARLSGLAKARCRKRLAASRSRVSER